MHKLKNREAFRLTTFVLSIDARYAGKRPQDLKSYCFLYF